METYQVNAIKKRETEKAVLVEIKTSAGWVDVWFPKSQVFINNGKVLEIAKWILRKNLLQKNIEKVELEGELINVSII